MYREVLTRINTSIIVPTTLTNRYSSLALIYDNPLIHLLYHKRFISFLQLVDLVSVKNRVISSVE